MNPRWKLDDEGGAALVVALGVLSIMVIIGVTVTALSMNSSKTVGHDTRITEAQNLAEAGVDDVIAVTMANYYAIYPYGPPDESYPGDGMPFYEGPQEVTDGDGNMAGTFEVWTKGDSERPGNVLITAEGTKGEEVTKVRVSVRYTASIFDYTLLVGDPEAPFAGNSRYGRSRSNGHGHGHARCYPSLELDADRGDASIAITGNTHVNGCLEIDSGSHYGRHHHSDHYSDDHHHRHSPGDVQLLSRDGFEDAATYTGSNTGDAPVGMQPVQGDAVAFPVVNFDSFTNVAVVELPADRHTNPWGRGWSRRSSHKFSISARDFQDSYGAYDVVSFVAPQDSEYEIEIVGSASDPVTITSTIMVRGAEDGGGDDYHRGRHNYHGRYGDRNNVRKLEIKGPGVSLMPSNGIAILTGEGRVEIERGVSIGAPGAGALVYITGQNRRSELEIEEGVTIYGSVVANVPEVELDADRDWHHGGGDIELVYDSAYLHTMPLNWWSGSDLSAVKENYERL